MVTAPVTSSQNLTFKETLHDIIFEADTRAGKTFDVILIIAISASVLVVMIDSVPSLHEKYHEWFYRMEIAFTLIFTIEYLVRVYCSPRRSRYIFSFFGVIDLLAILPTYLSFLLPGAQYIAVIRVIRVLRIFRVLKFMQYVRESQLLMGALYSARRKVFVFFFTLLTLIIILGSLMYLVEGPENGYDSIPRSIYWTIVTITTVGYGDISPQTPLGQALASLMMLIGYAVIAVPTGILTYEINRATLPPSLALICPKHPNARHEVDAVYCKLCGGALEAKQPHMQA